MDSIRENIFGSDNLEEFAFYTLFSTDFECIGASDLYHYTRAENEAHIIKKDYIDFRLTRADAFDDKNEGEHIRNLFKEICIQAKTEALIDETYAKMLLAVAEDYTSECERLRHCYVFCFSKDPQNEYLIKNYARKNGQDGVAFGIHAFFLEDLELDRKIAKNGEYNGVQLVDMV